MIRDLLRGQRGSSLVIALAFMALAIPVTTASLAFVSTAASDASSQSNQAIGHYGSTGGFEHALYRIGYEAGYADGLLPNTPDLYDITLNGRTVNISVEKRTTVPTDPPTVSYDPNRRLHASVVVSPATVAADTLTTYTYTVTVTNSDNEDKGLNQIINELPPGLTYVSSSTTGVTTDEPSISGQVLTWDVASRSITLIPNASVMLTFDAQGTLSEGVYCDEAWVKPGDEKTSSGKTAKITAGFPSTTTCAGVAVALTKTVTPTSAGVGIPTTYTYAIVVDNIGSLPLTITQIRDLLPTGFVYQTGTTTGSITTDDPNSQLFQGRERLTWTLSPSVVVAAGTQATLSIDASASVSAASTGTSCG